MYSPAKVAEDCNRASSRILMTTSKSFLSYRVQGPPAWVAGLPSRLKSTTANSRLGFITTLSHGFPPALVLYAASNDVCGFNSFECFKDGTVFSNYRMEGVAHNMQPVRAHHRSSLPWFSSDQDRIAVMVTSKTYLILTRKDCWSVRPMHYKFLADVPVCSRSKTCPKR